MALVMSQFSPFTPTISSSEMPLPLISAYDNPTYDPRPSLKVSSSRKPPKIPHLEVASPSSEKAGPRISPSLKWHLHFLSMFTSLIWMSAEGVLSLLFNQNVLELLQFPSTGKSHNLKSRESNTAPTSHMLPQFFFLVLVDLDLSLFLSRVCSRSATLQTMRGQYHILQSSPPSSSIPLSPLVEAFLPALNTQPFSQTHSSTILPNNFGYMLRRNRSVTKSFLLVYHNWLCSEHHYTLYMD